MFQDDSNDPIQTLCEEPPSSAGLASDSFEDGLDLESSNTEPHIECQSSNNNMKDSTVDTAEALEEETVEMLGKLPPELAMLLIISGIAGILLPGPVGTPLLIAGGVALWPKTFQPIELWFSKRFPVFHREGVLQIKEFLADLEKRFPTKEKVH